ncbi:hypothetical protein RDWZM_001712 [Blomia tropicalis]|uniref:Diphthine--ammonia ligase n=1 Tax=Blomia tropicalis TaxID=40697 RepID=A0A9Q0MET5_BLOTA|nr:hypothetical protein RDWZM_001712 [Blomia tropicalis]
MRFIALVSGGKDSCYAMHLTALDGNELVGLANLKPEQSGETDSYMYQTVGQDAIDLYSEAMEVPLFQRTIKGRPLNQEMEYENCVDGDEVEDLYELLADIKKSVSYEAVSCGAIHSNYQRVRAENVCERLGVKLLSPLWGREQGSLLKEMIDSKIEAILIKVAAMGLDPSKHLGKTIAQMYDELCVLRDKFGINVCGEGGEYETLTLDCPLFKKRIIIDQQEIVQHGHTMDEFAPVAYIQPIKMSLNEKIIKNGNGKAS